MKQRLLFADIARVLATLAVIIVHSSGQLTLQHGEIAESWWVTGVFYNSICRWCVPVFILISGYFLLQPNEETIAQFFRKRFSRVVIPYLVWAIIYTIYKFDNTIFIVGYIPWHDIWLSITQQEIYYHLWFVSMIIGLYLLTPFLRVFTTHASKKQLEYFLIVWFFMDSISVYCPLCIVVRYIGWLAYVGVFVFGFYLSRYDLPKRWLAPLFIIGLLITFFGTLLLNSSQQNFDDRLFYFLSPNVLAVSIALFEWMKNMNWEKFMKPSAQNIIRKISFLTYGMYLIHALWIDLLKNGYVGIKIYNDYFISAALNPMIAVPVFAVIVFVLSLFSAWIFSKIPVLKKALI